MALCEPIGCGDNAISLFSMGRGLGCFHCGLVMLVVYFVSFRFIEGYIFFILIKDCLFWTYLDFYSHEIDHSNMIPQIQLKLLCTERKRTGMDDGRDSEYVNKIMKKKMKSIRKEASTSA